MSETKKEDFKVGDIVICKDNGYFLDILTVGKEYKVVDTTPLCTYIKVISDKCSQKSFSPRRFTKKNKPKKKAKVVKFRYMKELPKVGDTLVYVANRQSDNIMYGEEFKVGNIDPQKRMFSIIHPDGKHSPMYGLKTGRFKNLGKKESVSKRSMFKSFFSGANSLSNAIVQKVALTALCLWGVNYIGDNFPKEKLERVEGNYVYTTVEGITGTSEKKYMISDGKILDSDNNFMDEKFSQDILNWLKAQYEEGEFFEKPNRRVWK